MQDESVCYREYPVHPALAPFVKCLWSLESERSAAGARRERILPDGCVELVFHFHDPFYTWDANGERSTQPRSLVVGQMRRFLEIAPTGRMGFVAVRFHVRGAYRFFSGPLNEVTARDVDLATLWGEDASRLTDRVAEARGMANRVRQVEEALLRRLRSSRHDRAVDRGLQLIEASDGQLNITRLAPDLGVSRRQLTRQFQQFVGMSPKEFARIRRFLRAVRSLDQREHGTLTDTAHACGYYDQAHFNHDFRELSGMTPREFFTFPNVAF